MANELFNNLLAKLDSPAVGQVEITPADSDLSSPVRALYIGVSGHVKITTLSGTIIEYKNVPVGWHAVICKRVWSTDTTATDIVGVTE